METRFNKERRRRRKRKDTLVSEKRRKKVKAGCSTLATAEQESMVAVLDIQSGRDGQYFDGRPWVAWGQPKRANRPKTGKGESGWEGRWRESKEPLALMLGKKKKRKMPDRDKPEKSDMSYVKRKHRARVGEDWIDLDGLLPASGNLSSMYAVSEHTELILVIYCHPIQYAQTRRS